jgi:hypothetical protein
VCSEGDDIAANEHVEEDQPPVSTGNADLDALIRLAVARELKAVHEKLEHLEHHLEHQLSCTWRCDRLVSVTLAVAMLSLP